MLFFFCSLLPFSLSFWPLAHFVKPDRRLARLLCRGSDLDQPCLESVYVSPDVTKRWVRTTAPEQRPRNEAIASANNGADDQSRIAPVGQLFLLAGGEASPVDLGARLDPLLVAFAGYVATLGFRFGCYGCSLLAPACLFWIPISIFGLGPDDSPIPRA